MKFVALDFETANELRSSPCEVSVVRYSDGKVADKFSTLIKPHSSVSFLQRNISIHGITADEVEKSPEFIEVLPKILDFINGDLIVAHSASFDVSVLRRTAELYKVEIDSQLNFLCSRVLAERDTSFELTSYSLGALCSLFSIDNFSAHRAESDAIACAQVTERLVSSAGHLDLLQYSLSLGIRPGVISGEGYEAIRVPKGSRFPSAMSRAQSDAFLNSLSESEIQEDDDFVGREVVFTGKLLSLERIEAQQMVVRAGGSTANSITKKTSLVVVGAPYDSELSDQSRLSGKLQKVMDLRSKGADVEVVTEDDFLRMIAD